MEHEQQKKIQSLINYCSLNKAKQETSLYYNAPKKIIDLVIDNNQEDIKLYKLISRNLKYQF